MCVDDDIKQYTNGGEWNLNTCDVTCFLEGGENLACGALNIASNAMGMGNACPSPYNPWDMIMKILMYSLIAVVVYIILKLILKKVNEPSRPSS